MFPINPTADEIEGQTAYPSILDAPVAKLDRISIYLPPSVARSVIEEIGQKPAGEVWFNPGADAPDVVERARNLGMNVRVGCSIVDIGISPHELD